MGWYGICNSIAYANSDRVTGGGYVYAYPLAWGPPFKYATRFVHDFCYNLL